MGLSGGQARIIKRPRCPVVFCFLILFYEACPHLTKPHILLSGGVFLEVLSYRDNLTGEPIYLTVQYILKSYGNNYNRLIFMKSPLRRPGYELPFDKGKKEKNEGKRSDSIYRAKSRVFEIAACNDFEFFGTCTISKEKYNRCDLEAIYKKLGKWLSNRTRTHGGIKYLILPELHSDKKNWHFHGLFKFENIYKNIVPFEIKKDMPVRQKKKIEELKKQGFFNFPDYAENFGFCSFGLIKDKGRAASYVTKYITKNIDNNKIDLCKKLYYCSTGLNRSKKIASGNIADLPEALKNKECVFENEYCKILVLNDNQISEFFSLSCNDFVI
jgi:hypothetical protein